MPAVVVSGLLATPRLSTQAPGAARARASGLSARTGAAGAALRVQQRRAVPLHRGRDVGGAAVRTRAALAEPPAAATIPEVVDPANHEIWPPEKVKGKPRVVVLGSGWAAVAFIKNLDPEHYAAALISPRNYFLYTPLLPGAATGTIEDRSIVTPIRVPIAEKGFRYWEAIAQSIDPVKKQVLCRATCQDVDTRSFAGSACSTHSFAAEYDYLVVAVGAIANTFNIPGVEDFCLFFKEVPDAVRFRREVSERFERATLPGTSPELARELLTFVFVGAGPTGVELAAELHDTVVEDIAKVYPRRLLEYVSIEIVDLQDFILSTYDRRIAEYATDHFKRQNIKLRLGFQVKKVEFGRLTLENKNTKELTTIPFGVCVWCTGIKLNPLAEGLLKALGPETQDNLRSLTVDRHLRVKGTEGSIFSLGDCATIELGPLRAAPHADRLFDAAGGSDSAALSVDELQRALKSAKAEFPHLEEASQRVKERYEKFTAASEQGLARAEFVALLEEADRGLRALPATAQVAKQEGEYLAAHFNRSAGNPELLVGPELPTFDYRHKGSLAYVGNDAAVADIPGFAIVKGISAGLLWKGFETYSQVSLRNLLLVTGDWIRAKIFGRDLSRPF